MILGVDPGASGGFAWQNGNGVNCLRMPKTDVDVLEFLEGLAKEARENSEEPVCFVEKVSGFIGTPNPGSRMFTFGRGFGFLLGVLMTLRWEINLVTPQKWQKSLGVGTKGERSGPEWKRFLKDEAARLFPNQKVTLATADALLILRFGLEKN